MGVPVSPDTGIYITQYSLLPNTVLLPSTTCSDNIITQDEEKVYTIFYIIWEQDPDMTGTITDRDRVRVGN